jgi:hypothetical protein
MLKHYDIKPLIIIIEAT